MMFCNVWQLEPSNSVKVFKAAASFSGALEGALAMQIRKGFGCFKKRQCDLYAPVKIQILLMEMESKCCRASFEARIKSVNRLLESWGIPFWAVEWECTYTKSGPKAFVICFIRLWSFIRTCLLPVWKNVHLSTANCQQFTPELLFFRSSYFGVHLSPAYWSLKLLKGIAWKF